MTATMQDEDIAIEVEEALPHGSMYQLPAAWWESFKLIEQRSESPSSFRSYKACPLRWWLERYSELPGSPSGFPAVVGTFVHRVLEVFYAEPAHLRNRDLLLRVFRTAWDAIKQRAKTGIIDERLQEEYNILEETDPNPDGMRGRFYNRAQAAVLAIEDFDGDMSEVEVISNETWVNLKMNGIKINGRIDRVVKNETRGGEVIQDYKTGKTPDPDEPIHVLSDSYLAMGMYAYMRIKGSNTGSMPLVTRVDLLYLSRRAEYKIVINPRILAMTELMMEKITEGMNQVAETGEIMCSPGETTSDGACGWCPASGMCPVWTDGTFSKIHEELGI